jgi:hypothetical protein
MTAKVVDCALPYCFDVVRLPLVVFDPFVGDEASIKLAQRARRKLTSRQGNTSKAHRHLGYITLRGRNGTRRRRTGSEERRRNRSTRKERRLVGGGFGAEPPCSGRYTSAQLAHFLAGAITRPWRPPVECSKCEWARYCSRACRDADLSYTGNSRLAGTEDWLELDRRGDEGSRVTLMGRRILLNGYTIDGREIVRGWIPVQIMRNGDETVGELSKVECKPSGRKSNERVDPGRAWPPSLRSAQTSAPGARQPSTATYSIHLYSYSGEARLTQSRCDGLGVEPCKICFELTRALPRLARLLDFRARCRALGRSCSRLWGGPSFGGRIPYRSPYATNDLDLRSFTDFKFSSLLQPATLYAEPAHVLVGDD